MPKITARLIDAIEPENKDIIIRDSELKGFICKITPKGKKVYMLYYRTKDSRERRPAIGIHGHITCYQAREIAIGWLGEIGKGKDPSLEKHKNRKSLTIAELAEKYLSEYATIHKKSYSIKIDKVHLKNDILPSLGSLKLFSLNTKDISDFHYRLKHKPITANRCLALISKMLNLAEKWGLREDANLLCKHIDKYPENKRDKFLSMAEIEKLFEILKEVEIKRIELTSSINAIKLLLLTGCRLSEILTLKWEYIDIEHYRINFPDSKSGKKTIYISPYVIDILNSIEKKLGNPYVIIGLVEGSHLVNLQKPWRRIRKKAGLEDVRIHDLRHSFASIGAASGLSLPIIGALLGHSQVKTTARYAHLVGDPLKEAAALITSVLD
jgi:integrase